MSTPSILPASLKFKGELSAEEDLLILGQIEGTIKHTQRVTVGKAGKVKATITAQVLRVEGTVLGDLHAERLCLLQFTARVRSRNDVRRFLRHTARDFAAVALDELRGLLSRQCLQRPCEDEGKSPKGTCGLLSWLIEVQSPPPELLDKAPRGGLPEPAGHRIGDRLAHAVDSEDVVAACGGDGIHRPEMASQLSCHFLMVMP